MVPLPMDLHGLALTSQGSHAAKTMTKGERERQRQKAAKVSLVNHLDRLLKGEDAFLSRSVSTGLFFSPRSRLHSPD